jgi:hypothetical protein
MSASYRGTLVSEVRSYSVNVPYICVQGGGCSLEPPQGGLKCFIHWRRFTDHTGELQKIRCEMAWSAQRGMGKSPTRCNNVKMTACERGLGAPKGMTTSGFDRDNSSRSCRGSCVPSTARYVSSHSSCWAGGVLWE